jgi:DNA-binding MarR family transcriptional regulator
MNDSYLEVIQLLPKIHRQFMDVVKRDLEGIKINDINNVQSIMLFNIGDTTLSVGDLILSGVYIGSNVSYHVKMMVENGYLTQEHSLYDRRVSHVRVTEKGRKLREELAMAHQRRIDLLADVALNSDELQAAMSVLRLLDRFWTDVAGPGRRLPPFA